MRRAIQLNPSYPSARHYFTLLLMMFGRLDEATAQNRLTVSLDPFSVSGNATRGVLLCQRGNYTQARRALEKALPLGTKNIDLAFAEAVMGDVNRSYTILGKSTKWDMPTVIELRNDPLLVAFRADGRYPKLLAAIGLSN